MSKYNQPLRMNTYNNFNFVGEVIFADEKVRVNSGETKYGLWELISLNMGIRANTGSSTNTQFLSISDMKNNYDTFRTYSKTGEMMEVNNDDSQNIEIIKQVMQPRQIVVDLTETEEGRAENTKMFFQISNIERRIRSGNGEPSDEVKLEGLIDKLYEMPDRHYFINKMDFVEFMIDKSDELEGKRLKVMGEIEWSFSKNGNMYVNFVPNTITYAEDYEEDRLDATIDIAFHQASLDESFVDSSKKLIVNGFVQNYSRDDKALKLFPQEFVLDLSRVDLENEQHKGIYNYLKSCYTTDGDIVNVLKTEVEILNGTEDVELSQSELENMLTEDQKMMIDLGIATEDEYLTDSAIGRRIEEFRIVKPVVKGMYKDGAIEVDLTEQELYKEVAQSDKVASREDVVIDNTKEKDSNEVSKEDVSNVLDGLFKEGNASSSEDDPFGSMFD